MTDNDWDYLDEMAQVIREYADKIEGLVDAQTEENLIQIKSAMLDLKLEMDDYYDGGGLNQTLLNME